MGSSGLEPPTSRLSGARSNHLSYEPICVPVAVSFLSLFELPVSASALPSFAVGGDEGNRTLDPLLAGQVLSQLSYTPTSSHLSMLMWFLSFSGIFSSLFSFCLQRTNLFQAWSLKVEQRAFRLSRLTISSFCFVWVSLLLNFSTAASRLGLPFSIERR